MGLIVAQEETDFPTSILRISVQIQHDLPKVRHVLVEKLAKLKEH